MTKIKIDKFKGKRVQHDHSASDVYLDSGVSVETAIASGIVPDIWTTGITAIRAFTDHEVGKDDIGNFLTGYVYQATTSAVHDNDDTILKPTDIPIIITATANQVTLNLQVVLGVNIAFDSGIQATPLAAAIALNALIDAHADFVSTIVGSTITITNTTANNYISINTIVGATDNTVQIRWVKQFVLVDTLLTQTLSNKTLNNIPLKVVTIGSVNSNYTTIQAALTANATANVLFLVYPGTYVDDTIAFTANNQIVQGVSDSLGTAIATSNNSIITVGAFTGCTVKNITIALHITDGGVDHLSTVTTGSLIFDNAILSVVVDTTSIATALQPALGYITHAGEIHFRENCIINYDNESDDAGGLAVKVPFIMDRDGYISAQDSSISIDSTNATNIIAVTAMASYTGTGGLWGDMRFVNCDIDVDDDRASYVMASGYIIGVNTAVEEYYNCTINVSKANTVAVTVMSALYNSSAAAARIESYNNVITVTNLHTTVSAYSYYQVAGTVNVYNDNVFYAAGGEFGTITRLATTHGLINHVIGNYIYDAAKIVSDTVLDRRMVNTAGVLSFERCVIASTTKGDATVGNWVNDLSFNATGIATFGNHINFTGADRNIYNVTNHALVFGTNNTERMRIDGNVTVNINQATGGTGAANLLLNSTATYGFQIVNSGRSSTNTYTATGVLSNKTDGYINYISATNGGLGVYGLRAANTGAALLLAGITNSATPSAAPLTFEGSYQVSAGSNNALTSGYPLIYFKTYSTTVLTLQSEGSLIFTGQNAISITMARHTTTNTPGNSLTIAAGGIYAASTTDNLAGGDLIFQSGVNHGTGANNILFKTYLQNANPDTEGTLTTAMTIDNMSNICIGGLAGATAQKVLSLTNTAVSPTNSANIAQLYARDTAAGNATLALFAEQVVAAVGADTPDTTFNIWINGTEYKMFLLAV